jgi:lysyl-tRNA synthetase class 1
MMETPPKDSPAIEHASWPFQEAKKIQVGAAGDLTRAPLVFMTGFGPSGLPHIGTFAEVVRTSFIIQAFEQLTGRPGVLYAFCDDMDGLRKVPKNLPQPEMLAENLGRPISKIPDPFGCCASFAGHMENKLKELLDRYHLPYQLKSSAVEYQKGVFNPALHLILEKVEEIKAVILPTLQEENQGDWSPFFPICEKCGRLYTTRVKDYYPKKDSLKYVCDGTFGRPWKIVGCGHKDKISILDGKVKVGWKVDWAMRWLAYQVRYEMFGKDLIDSGKLSGKIVRVLGGEPPAGMTYEMFLSEEGKKISKSVGEGLAVEDWLRYAPLESMLFYLYQNPKKQRRLYFDVIPKSVDDYLAELLRYPSREETQAQDSVVWHLRKMTGQTPSYSGNINYSLVLHLIQGIGADDHDLLHDYLLRYDPSVAENRELVEQLVQSALNYFRDFIEPHKQYRTPDARERELLQKLRDRLTATSDQDANLLQSLVFDLARENGMEAAEFFKLIYQVLLGQDRGPRFGTFVTLVGKERVVKMLEQKLAAAAAP